MLPRMLSFPAFVHLRFSTICSSFLNTLKAASPTSYISATWPPNYTQYSDWCWQFTAVKHEYLAILQLCTCIHVLSSSMPNLSMTCSSPVQLCQEHGEQAPKNTHPVTIPCLNQWGLVTICHSIQLDRIFPVTSFSICGLRTSISIDISTTCFYQILSMKVGKNSSGFLFNLWHTSP